MEQQSLSVDQAEPNLTADLHLHAALGWLSINCSAEKDKSLSGSRSDISSPQSYPAQAKNNLPPPPTVYDIPEEILAHVFFIVINDARPGNREEELIESTIRFSYRNLFILSSVCSEWRRVCLSRGAFWSLIPLYNEWKDPNSIMNLCLERVGCSDIHLGGALGDTIDAKVLEIIAKYGPRIRKFSTYGSHIDVLRQTAASLLEHSNPGRLVNLSLHNYEITQDHHSHYTWPLLFPLTSPEHNLFNSFVESLSSLRLWGFKLNWCQVRFSELTDLKLQHLCPESLSEVEDILSAVALAPKLRSLQLVDIRLHEYFIQNRPLDRRGELPLLHPSLEFLYLKNIRWSLLSLIIQSIISGSYKTVVSYTRRGYLERYSSDRVSLESSCLQGYNVHTLMTSRNWIQESGMLRSLLKAMPTIQTLCIARCEFTKKTFEALVRPSETRMDNELGFPVIRRLHVMYATFEHTVLERLKDVVTSHRIQELMIGGSMSKSESDQAAATLDLERFVRFENPKDDERTASIRIWLENTISKVTFVKRVMDLPDFCYQTYDP